MTYPRLGIIFIVLGLLACIDMVTAPFFDRVSINVVACCLPVGLGLRRGKPSSRTWAQIWLWLLAILGAVLALAAALAAWRVAGRPVDPPHWLRALVVLALGACAGLCWRGARWVRSHPYGG